MCGGQQSAMLQKQLSSWIGMRTLQPPIKVAFPLLIERSGDGDASRLRDVQCAGLRSGNCQRNHGYFAGDEMAELAASLGVKIPHYELSAFVQKKSAKVKALVSAAKAPRAASGANASAALRSDSSAASRARSASAAVAPKGDGILDDWRSFVAPAMLPTLGECADERRTLTTR